MLQAGQSIYKLHNHSFQDYLCMFFLLACSLPKPALLYPSPYYLFHSKLALCRPTVSGHKPLLPCIALSCTLQTSESLASTSMPRQPDSETKKPMKQLLRHLPPQKYLLLNNNFRKGQPLGNHIKLLSHRPLDPLKYFIKCLN